MNHRKRLPAVLFPFSPVSSSDYGTSTASALRLTRTDSPGKFTLVPECSSQIFSVTVF
jgi:hypothetical protein